MEQLLYTELFFDIITLDINVSFRVGCFAREDGVKSLKARMRASRKGGPFLMLRALENEAP